MMKKLLTVAFIVLSIPSMAQVAISTNGSLPDSSAMLDIKSTTRGLLPPRMTIDQIVAINKPVAGLIVYCTSVNLLLIYDGTNWVKINGDPIYTIGSSLQGGTVFYVPPPGLYAYIISDDLNTNLPWGCYGVTLGVPSSGAIGTGNSNTSIIVAGCPDPNTAASFCKSLNWGSYSDWFLPSRAELTTAISSLRNVNGTFVLTGNYWSSNESSNSNFAWRVNTGGYYTSRKDILSAVRCVRYTGPSTCSPQPNAATAGSDKLNLAVTSTMLEGNSPESGNTGLWTIYSGTGGSISDPSNPTSSFTGLAGNSYTLIWKITNSCGTSEDAVNISFRCSPYPTTANAGSNQYNIPGTSTSLQANTPVTGTGQWSIISGTGGNIATPSNPNSTFTGVPGVDYVLRWTITACSTSYSEVELRFTCIPPTQADAGPDQMNATSTLIILQGNTPTVGTGTWTIQYNADGGGQILDPHNPNTIFIGRNGRRYTLTWTISNNCGETYDYVDVRGECSYPYYFTANAGPDQVHLSGTSTTLSASTIHLYGDNSQTTGSWLIASGNGGNIADPFNPNSSFTGISGGEYWLRWTIHDVSYGCTWSTDSVFISFNCPTPSTLPNAGPDQLNLAGNSTTLQGNIPQGVSAHWDIVQGTGGFLSDPTSPTSTFTGIQGGTYLLAWNFCGGGYDYTDISFQCPSVNAGPDQLEVVGTSATLEGNVPVVGTGSWSIISGTGGNIAAPSNPHATLTGQPGNSYTLRYTGTCESGPVTDDVVISFQCTPQPSTANSGPDQLNLNNLSTTLQGNTPAVGTGFWQIISGVGGGVADSLNNTTSFTGIEGRSYTLRWNIYNVCGISQDDVVISFACPVANAGTDQSQVPGTSTTLQANTPTVGTGSWSIVSGTGGNIVQPSNPSSTFTGQEGLTYTLRWTVTSNCAAAFDNVVINFACATPPTTANAGPDQLNVAGASTTLQGNTATVGIGAWSIVSGTGGFISQGTSPTSTFIGLAGSTYVLSWHISSGNCISSDLVTISFAAFACGNSFLDTRDYKVYNSVQIGSQCWMKENLNYAVGSSTCLGGNQTNCDNYGRQYDWTTASTACPSSWHLPSQTEWCTLVQGVDGTVACGTAGTLLGADAGGKMKETGTTYWQAPNTGATNSSGFSARAGGNTTGLGPLGQRGSWWTSTTISTNRWSWEMIYNDQRILNNNYSTTTTMSVRCIK